MSGRDGLDAFVESLRRVPILVSIEVEDSRTGEMIVNEGCNTSDLQTAAHLLREAARKLEDRHRRPAAALASAREDES